MTQIINNSQFFSNFPKLTKKKWFIFLVNPLFFTLHLNWRSFKSVLYSNMYLLQLPGSTGLTGMIIKLLKILSKGLQTKYGRTRYWGKCTEQYKAKLSTKFRGHERKWAQTNLCSVALSCAHLCSYLLCAVLCICLYFNISDFIHRGHVSSWCLVCY